MSSLGGEKNSVMVHASSYHDWCSTPAGITKASPGPTSVVSPSPIR